MDGSGPVYCTWSCWELKFDVSGIQLDSLSYYTDVGPHSGTYYDGTGFLTTSMVDKPAYLGSAAGNTAPFVNFVSKDLLYRNATGNTYGHFNVSNTVSSTGDIADNGYKLNNLYINITQGNGNAQVYNLWTTTYTNNGVQAVTFNQIPLPNHPFPNVTSTIPTTSNGLNLSATTTICFQCANTPLTTLAPGVQFPYYGVAILAIIFVMLIGSMFSYEQTGHFPVVIGIIMLWVSGFFAYPLFAVAIIGTVIFVIAEQVKPKPHV